MLSRSGLRARVAGARLADHRTVPRRVPARGAAHCQVVAVVGGEFWMATVRNLSATGLSLRSEVASEVGTLLTVELLNRAHTRSRTVLAWVVHLTPRQDGDWVIGCSLTQEMDENEVRELLN